MKMKLIISIVFFIIATSLTAEIKTEGIIKIEIGERKNTNISHENNLDKRIWSLELAVIQLQKAVFKLKNENDRLREENELKKPKQDEKEYTYYIQTPFSGTHYGKGTSPAEAKAKTLRSCEQATGSIWCKEDRLKTD